MNLNAGNKTDDLSQDDWRECLSCGKNLPNACFEVHHGERSHVCFTCERDIEGEFDPSVSEKTLDRSKDDYVPLDGLGIPNPYAHIKTQALEFDFEAEAAAMLRRRELARRNLLPFISEFKAGYSVGWVHKDICKRLKEFAEKVERGENPRLMLFMPPRSGKSEIVSRNFPAWFLGRNPDKEIIACSYASSLANSFSRKVRDILRDPAYKHIFPQCELDKDNQAVEQWMTTEGGGYVSAGVGGSIVGKGAHVLIIDDPVKGREEAKSEKTKESIRDWYTGSAYTRLAPGGGVLIIMQRWAEDDLAGWLLAEDAANEDENTKESWEVVLYPAIAEQDEKYRRKGEALHRERYDEKAFARIRRTVGERDWNALFQQNPLPDSGDYFKEEMFSMVGRSEYPSMDEMQVYAAWDLAIGEREENDFSVGFYIGVCPNKMIWILHVEKCKLDSKELTDKFFELDELYRPIMTGFEQGHIEKAIGPFLDEEMIRLGHYFTYEPLKVGRKDKQVRATTIRGMMQRGIVHWDRNSVTQMDAKAEMLKFPNGKHDDHVDAIAHIGIMIRELVSKRKQVAKKKGGWREEFLKKQTRKQRAAIGGGGSFMAS